MIKVSRRPRCAYPPVGRHIKPAGVICPKVKIPSPNELPPLPQLRPDGVRQSTAEARILSHIRAVQNGTTSPAIDLLSR